MRFDMFTPHASDRSTYSAYSRIHALKGEKSQKEEGSEYAEYTEYKFENPYGSRAYRLNLYADAR